MITIYVYAIFQLLNITYITYSSEAWPLFYRDPFYEFNLAMWLCLFKIKE